MRQPIAESSRVVMEHQSSMPKLITGKDGLLHCTLCQGPESLCAYHKKQVRLAIGLLQTVTLLQGARDVRYLVAARTGDES